jgi:hypothetical protein
MNRTLRLAAIAVTVALESFCLLDLLGGFLLAPLSFSYKLQIFLPAMLFIALILALVAALLLHPGSLKGGPARKQLLRSLPLMVWCVAAGSILLLAAIQAVTYLT